MRFIPQIPNFPDTRFLGRGANDAWNALLETLDMWRKAIQQPVHISGGPGIAVRDDQGFTISLMDQGTEAEEKEVAGGNAIIVKVAISTEESGEPFIPALGEPATYKYKVTALDGTFIADPVSQERQRMLTNLIPGRGFGIGFYEGEKFRLWDAGETPVVFKCVPAPDEQVTG